MSRQYSLKDGFKAALRGLLHTFSPVDTRVAVTTDPGDSLTTSDSPTTTSIINLPMPSANTEYSQALPSNIKSLNIKARGTAKLQLAFTVGQSGVEYITIPPGSTYISDNYYANLTLYLTSSKNGETAEITVHTT